MVPAGVKAVRGLLLASFNAPDWVASRYHGTDKYPHGYIPHYRQMFGPLRLRRMTVYEIGVGGYRSEEPGGSLQLWRDYFPRSTIVGVDISPKSLDYGPRVKVEVADQSSTEQLKSVVGRHGPPDIVIDDGSHVGAHQRASFEFFWPLMPSGGVYAVEDLATSYDPQFGGQRPAPASSGVGLMEELLTDVQGRDLVWQRPKYTGLRPGVRHHDVASVHVFPGLAFVVKA
jgi:hypothetical protein